MPISDDATELTLQLYSSPQRIQAKALDMLEEKVLDGNEMPDGNNPATFLMEFSATVASGIVNEMSNSINALYPARAMTTKDLFRHMSDYDYVNLFSTPATMELEIALNRNYLIQNAVQYGNGDYKKIIIPQQSTFKVGEYTFGIHYPIEIQIREARNSTGIDYDKCIISTQWDLSVANPLAAMTTNVLENRTYVRDGISIFCIKIPVYQFVNTLHQEDVISSTGFMKQYDYTDKFYAVRIFHYFETQPDTFEWVEMAQTLSEIVYDPDVVTAKFGVYTDLNKLQVEIPQVYFTRNLIGSKLRIYVYTTKGALNVDISEYTADQFSASFLLNDNIIDDTYSFMLKRIPYCQVLPYSMKISSGSNGLTFEELRDRVIHDSAYQLLITKSDIVNYFKDQGFIAKTYLDNLTDRIYLAQRVMTNDSNVPIKAGDVTAVMDSSIFKTKQNDEGQTVLANYDTIKYIGPQSYLIMPNTVFKYDDNKNVVVPMNNDWHTTFDNMSLAKQVELMNSGTYTYSPFHLKMSVINNIPVSTYYDLLKPEISHTTFIGENTNTTSQVSIYQSKLEHRNHGTGGYRLWISLYKTADLAKLDAVVDEDYLKFNIKVVLKTKTYDGSIIYMYGKSDIGLKDSTDHDLFVFDITTDYVLDNFERFGTHAFSGRSSGLKTYAFLDLIQDFDLMFFVNDSDVDNPIIKAENPNFGVDRSEFPMDLTANDVWLATQRLTLKFGEPINALFTNVAVNVEAQQYQKYPTTQFATFDAPVYKRYEKGDVDADKNPIDPNLYGTIKIPLEMEHDAGDIILNKVYDRLIPQACMIMVKDTEDGPWSLHNQWLQPTYTATSSYTNVWRGTYTVKNTTTEIGDSKDPITDDQGNTTYFDGNNWSIDIVDGMQYMIDDVGNTTVPTPKDLNLVFEEEEYVNDVGETKTRLITKDPYLGKMFVFVEVAESDPSLPENTISELVTDKDGRPYSSFGTVYRRDTEYSSFDYTKYQYKTADMIEPDYLTAEVLEKIYEDYDTTTYTFEDLKEKYDISASVIQILCTKVRRPWIKLIDAYDIETIDAYWKHRKIINTTAVELRDIQLKLNKVNTVETIVDLIKLTNVEPGTVYYVENVDFNLIFHDRLLGDYDVPAGLSRGGLAQYHVPSATLPDGWQWINTGPSLSTCVVRARSQNTFSGYMYVASNNDADTPKRYVNLLSMNNGKFDITLDGCTWGLINKWPWEVKDWVDVATGAKTKLMQVVIDTNTSAKIAHFGGEVELSDTGKLVGVITDANGDPIPESSAYADTRKVTYNVKTLQVDYALTLANDPEYKNYREDITNLLRSYFSTIKTARQSLLERTDLFYSPIRTMGSAEFKGSNNAVMTKPLDITMAFRLYVKDYIYSSVDSKETIRANVLNIIDKHIASGSVSTSRIAEEIRASLSDTVLLVENLGINGDSEQRVLIMNEQFDECKPHLKQLLVVKDNGEVTVERGVTLEYVTIA